MKITVPKEGSIIINNCTITGTLEIDATEDGKIMISGCTFLSE